MTGMIRLPASGLRLPAILGALSLLAAGLALAPLREMALLAVGAGIALTVLIHPWLGLLLIAIAVPFGPLAPLPVAGSAADINEILVALVLAAWLARGVARRAIIIPHPPLLIPALLLLGAFLASLPSAWSPRDGLIEMAKWLEGGVLYLAVVALLPRRRVPWLLGALLLAGAAQALLGLYQFERAIGPSQYLVLGRFIRAYGTFRQPNPFGGYLGLLAPVALSLAWWMAAQNLPPFPPFPKREGGRGVRLMTLMTPLAAAGVISLGLIASWSRGAWMGFAAALAVIVLARGRRSTAGIVALVAILAALALATGYGGAGVIDVLLSRAIGGEGYTSFADVRTLEVTDANFATVQRLAQWQAAWGIFSDHPWLGVGIGNYAVAYPTYALPHWYEPLGHAHNYYLNVAAESGLIGLAAYLIAGAAAILWVIRFIRRQRGWPQALAIGVLGTLAHLSIHNLVDNLYVQHMILCLALLLGALAVLNETRSLAIATTASPQRSLP
jgi:O-antigen ligase